MLMNSLPTKKRPCHGCTKRWVDVEHHTNCHATCKEYLQSRVEQDEKLVRIYKEKECERGLNSVHYYGKK